MLGRYELIFIIFVIILVFGPFFARRAGVRRKPKRSSSFFRNRNRKIQKTDDFDTSNATPVDFEEVE